MKFHQPPTTYVSEVELKVSDIKKATDFYTKIIGLKVKDQSESAVTFTTNDQDSILTIQQPKNVQQRHVPTTGLYHFALLLPSRSDLAQVVKHFLDHHVQFGAGDHLVSEAIYLADLDGNGIEIYVDRDPNNWEWKDNQVTMTTDPVDFDGLLKELPNTPFQGLSKNTTMGHVHLQVNDLKQNEHFYVDGLGFSVVSRYGKNAVFISDNGYHHHLAFNNWAGNTIGHSKDNETGLASLCVVFESEQKRNDKLARLKELGFVVENKNDDYYAIDPSQVKVKLLVSE